MLSNDKISMQSAVEIPESLTALSLLKDKQNDKAIVVHVFFSQQKNVDDLVECQLLAQ